LGAGQNAFVALNFLAIAPNVVFNRFNYLLCADSVNTYESVVSLYDKAYRTIQQVSPITVNSLSYNASQSGLELFGSHKPVDSLWHPTFIGYDRSFVPYANFNGAGNALPVLIINVGINEPSPEGRLHVKDGSAGTVVAQTSSVGVFESGGNAYLSLLSPNSHYAGVVMGGPTNSYGSYMSWNHDNLALKVATNLVGASIPMLAGTEQEAMRITSAGNVGIGTSTPNERLTVSGNISATNTIFASGGKVVVSSPNAETSTVGLSAISNIIALSQTTYNALAVKRPDTYYIII
jgi:hypothetical protein